MQVRRYIAALSASVLLVVVAGCDSSTVEDGNALAEPDATELPNTTEEVSREASQVEESAGQDETRFDQLVVETCASIEMVELREEAIALIEDARIQAADSGLLPARVETAIRDKCDLPEQANARAEDSEPEEVDIDPDAALALERAMFSEMIETGDEFREAFIAVYDLVPGIRTFDRLAYDDGADTLKVSLTSEYRSPDNRVESAWEITRLTAELPIWGGEIEWLVHLVPDLHLEVSDVTVRCSGEMMERLRSARASRADWASECLQ